jgi:GTP pyrophosphokinase
VAVADPQAWLAASARAPESLRRLVEGQQQAERVWALHASRDAAGGSEGLRRLLLAIIRDLRVVYLLLARQLAKLRAAASLPEAERRELAQLTRDIHAPLANRLGIGQWKWELEDLAFRYLQPDTYHRIAALLDERRADREAWIARCVAALREALRAQGLDASVDGRAKHIYSIWRKMQRKRIGFGELYDIRALRVLTHSVADCYAVLGVVHALWPIIPQEFDDYIARPKGNNYRSLHTAVIGPEGKPLEVQIRTRDMHQHSEYGVAAHWRYKEGRASGVRHDPTFDEKIAWLRQVLEWKDSVADSSEWLAAFRESLFTDAIYVLTPQGKVIDLPRGATPVDFAYAVHTGLGHRCRGARVDGQMVPLNYQLSSGQQVEVIAVKQGGPSRDWLNSDLGYVHGNRARSKVRQWFKAQQHEETVAQGRALVERELARLGRTALKLDAVAAKAGFDKTEDFFAAFARDDINSKQVQAAILALAQPGKPASPGPAPAEPEVATRQSRAASSGGGILVVGVDRLLTGLA